MNRQLYPSIVQIKTPFEHCIERTRWCGLIIEKSDTDTTQNGIKPNVTEPILSKNHQTWAVQNFAHYHLFAIFLARSRKKIAPSRLPHFLLVTARSHFWFGVCCWELFFCLETGFIWWFQLVPSNRKSSINIENIKKHNSLYSIYLISIMSEKQCKHVNYSTDTSLSLHMLLECRQNMWLYVGLLNVELYTIFGTIDRFAKNLSQTDISYGFASCPEDDMRTKI